MHTFTIKLNEISILVQVTRLSGSAPEHDYIPYHIISGRRRGTMWVHDSTLPKPALSTEQDAWNYLEWVLYPEHDPFFCEGDFFSSIELRQVHRAIVEYHQKHEHEAK